MKISNPKNIVNAQAKAQAKVHQALGLHQQGQLAQAQALYEQALQIQPGNFDALHLLGVISVQINDPARAVELIGKAININPNNAMAYYNHGVALHGLKQHEAAIESYNRAIALKPDYADAYNNRGNALAGLKQHEAAIQSFDQAIALWPGYAEAHNNRGVALKELERYEAAIQSFDQAIALNPAYADAYNNRGTALRELGQHEAAIQSFDQAIALRADYADAYNNRGIALAGLKQHAAAIQSYDQAIALRPGYAEAHNNRSVALKELKQHAAALQSFDQAIALNPGNADAHYNRGDALFDLKQYEAAIQNYDQALAIRPGHAEACNNRGNALKALNRFDDALDSYDRALRIKPDFAEAYNNRGYSLKMLKRFNDALDSYDRALRIKPDFAEAHLNLSACCLLLGDYARGWKSFEWRWETEQLENGKRHLTQPLWLGEEPLAGKSILLYAEQGLGDTIQFCRYAKMVADLGAQVILEVQEPLLPLLTTLDGVSQLVARGSALPPFDYQCPLLSLPLAFKTELSSIPAPNAYLESDPAKRLYWKEKLGEKNKLRIGLVWAAGFRPYRPELLSVNELRNIDLSKFARLKDVDVEFFSLQKGQPAESDLAKLKASLWDGPEIIDHTGELGDFSDTAALVDNLDLVISVDTSTAHLAGALGKPVWVLTKYDACWRWLLDREDSPWYPTVNLYRQEQPGDWDGVLERVKADLEGLQVADSVPASHD